MSRILCRCNGNPECKLCLGGKRYDYEPGPRGWMPFVCPTCEGKKELPGTNGEPATACFTCGGAGAIDPAKPPRDTTPRGFLRDLWRIYFGG